MIPLAGTDLFGGLDNGVGQLLAGKVLAGDVAVGKYEVNPALPANAFPIPPALQGKAAKPAAMGKVPYQWVIRRLSNGFYLDTDAVYSDEGDTLKLTDIGPNITMATGASHNTLLDYAVAVG